MLHTLSLVDASPYSAGGFICNICRESGCGPVYHCADCEFDVHVSCAATAKQQTHISHPQHLLHLVQCTTLRHTCDSCGRKIHSLSFRCDPCNFDIHPTCARAPRFIKHPRHQHPLTLQSAGPSSGSLHCNGCRQPVKQLFYQCNSPLAGSGSCKYVLHQVCASLPTQVKHPKHQQHTLKLLDGPLQEEMFWCSGCGAQSRGWHFACLCCDFRLDPACATSVHEFAQPHQECVGIAQDRSKATSASSATSLVMSNISHASVLNSVSQAPMPSDNEWEAFEKVLRFARELVKGRSLIDAAQGGSAESSGKEEKDICPTCLEGYDLNNPKKLTSCGHHFHLECILNWMERNSSCPICRKFVTIPM